MKKDRPYTALVLTIVLLAGCSSVREGMEGHGAAVARVEGFTLTVEHAARLLADASEAVIGPPGTEIPPIAADPVVDLWVSFTLLALELASPDTFSNVDIDPLVGHAVDQTIVWDLHDDVIMAPAQPSQDELREMYERERPFDAVRVQHVLISIPNAADSAEVDRLRRLAEDVRGQALAGANFDELAREYSGDPATASNGGHLGWVERARILPELEAVVFQLEPGTVSETVRTPLGYHVVKVLESRAPDFESAEARYRNDLLNTRVHELEDRFINTMMEEANIRFAPRAAPLARQLAVSPRLERLSAAERRARLVTYRGGELTVGELADFLLRGRPNSISMFVDADSAGVLGMLRELVRNELLARRARQEGHTLSQQQADSLRGEAVRSFGVAVALSGLERENLLGGDYAITTAVDEAILEVLTRQRSPRAMERVAPALKAGRNISVYPHRFPELVARVAQIRAEREGGRDQASAIGRVDPTLN